MSTIRTMLKKITKSLRGVRRDVATQVLLPQLDRMLYNLIKVDQDHLNDLLAQDPQRKSLIEGVKKSIQQHTKNLVALPENRLTPEEETLLFEKVSEDWNICKSIALKQGKVLND